MFENIDQYIANIMWKGLFIAVGASFLGGISSGMVLHYMNLNYSKVQSKENKIN